MRYSLLTHVACPSCLGPLLCLTHTEVPSQMPAGPLPDASRVSPGPGVGPTPAWRFPTELTTLLDQLASEPAPPERGREVEVESGLLICGECGRWFPIEGQIPELLPDHLRDVTRELPMFERVTAGAPEALTRALRFRPVGDAASDPGAHYKKAEIGISNKVDDPLFFGPGYSSPFQCGNSDFSVYLIKLFGAVAPLLNLKRGEIVLDSGCGYAWTTEWLFRSGFNAIGVDICRTYLEIGVTRIGASRPHLVVGDVENLPLQSGIAHAVLAYESFHHIPNRRRAMTAYHRLLQEGRTVILAEPNAAHEVAQVAVDAMKKYGILEKGMELDDVAGYADGTTFRPEQVFLVCAVEAELGARLDRTFVKDHSAVEGNIFRLVKGGRPAVDVAPLLPRRRGPARLMSGMKRRLKAALRAP